MARFSCVRLSREISVRRSDAMRKRDIKCHTWTKHFCCSSGATASGRESTSSWLRKSAMELDAQIKAMKCATHYAHRHQCRRRHDNTHSVHGMKGGETIVWAFEVALCVFNLTSNFMEVGLEQYHMEPCLVSSSEKPNDSDDT